jgi:outer membrane protein
MEAPGMKKICSVISAVSVAVIWSGAARGETLEQAWTTALAVDQRIAASSDQIQAAECTTSAAVRSRVPSIKNTTGYTSLTDSPSFAFGGMGVTILDQDFVASATMAQVPIYTGGAISSAVNAASAQANATRHNHRKTILDVKLEVAIAYTTVLRAQKAVETAQANEESLRAHEKVIRTLLERGQVPQNDLLAAEVALADAVQKGLQAQNALAISRANYNRLAGRMLQEPVDLAELSLSPMAGQLEPLIQRALATRPELNVLACQAEALRHQAESTSAATRPHVGAQGGYVFFESPAVDPNSYGAVMLNLEWKPFDGGVTRSKSNSILHNANSVSRMRQNLQSVVRFEVQNAWLTEQETRKRIDVTSKAISQAEENLRAAKIRFQNGAAINTEVLDAETLRTKSYDNYYNAIYDAVLATFKLQRAVGTL